MPENDKASSGLVQSVSDNLGAFFRHLFPGILITGAAYVIRPSWFKRVDLDSWQHVSIAALAALAAGNLWFATNRYVIHQFVDYLSYLLGSKGPAPTTSRFRYIDDLAKHTTDSLYLEIPTRARQHIAFRASAIFLLYTVAEVGFLAAIWSEDGTLFARHPIWTTVVALAIFFGAIWQNFIVRRIDDELISRAKQRQ